MRFCTRCGSRFETEAFCPHDGEPTQELPESDDAPTLIGQVVDDRYRVDAQIGEGGMGIVYRATHTALNKTLALKILRIEMAKDPQVVQRFIQEAQAATSIGHENIIDISDFGKLPDGSVYFVMEYLDGQPLTDVISLGGPVPVARAVRVVQQMASAVGAAHAQGIVHRDLKPDNIFLIRRGEAEDFVKVLDFGIAKVGGASNKLTQTGMVFGTPHYMSPEQAAGQSVDHRTDIYALGVIMYELFTGHVPFDADTFMGVLTKHMFEEPPPMMREGDDRLLGALEVVTFKALAKKPEHRYQSMEELLADLELAMGGQLAPRRESDESLADELEPRSMSEVDLERRMRGNHEAERKNRRALVLGGLVGLGIVGAAVAFVLSLDDPERDARAELEDASQTELGAPAPEPPSEPAMPEPVPVEAPEPPPPAPEVVISLVEILSDPAGAAVVVDGAIIGSTPLKLPRPKPGSLRKLSLRTVGYADKDVRLSPDSPERILVTLARAPVARPQPNRVKTPVTAPTPPRSDPDRPERYRRSEVLDPWAD